MKKTKTCEWCGEEYTPHPRSHNQKFCKTECKYKEYYGRTKKRKLKLAKIKRNKDRKPKICLICGEAFTKKGSFKYCKKECRHEATILINRRHRARNLDKKRKQDASAKRKTYKKNKKIIAERDAARYKSRGHYTIKYQYLWELSQSLIKLKKEVRNAA